MVGVVTVALVGGVAAVLVLRGDAAPSPEEALADARTAVDDASVGFSVRVERTLPDGTTLSTEQGEWADGIWHVTIERAIGTAETVIEPDGAVLRVR